VYCRASPLGFAKNQTRRSRHTGTALIALPGVVGSHRSQGYVFDGEIVCLDEAGKPVFNDLLFRRREPVYVAFDVLNVEGADVRRMPLKDRRAILDGVAMRYGIQKAEPFFCCGKSLFKAVCGLDLEGIIAKKLDDPYDPERTSGGSERWIFAKGRTCRAF
jgi:bifunctional non-homologous end joining protein LigD